MELTNLASDIPLSLNQSVPSTNSLFHQLLVHQWVLMELRILSLSVGNDQLTMAVMISTVITLNEEKNDQSDGSDVQKNLFLT